MFRRVKTTYDMNEPSVPVPIIAHSNEVILPVKLCKKLFPILKSGREIPKEIKREMLELFETTQIAI
jgi:hypothetical protein